MEEISNIEKPDVPEDGSFNEAMEWIINGTSGSYDGQLKPGRQSLVTLCCATLFMSLLSVIANYVTLLRLIRTKVKNITLLTMKSCVSAEILSTLMFIVFVSPAWFTGKVIYSAVTCSVEAFLQAWAQLFIHAGLIFLLIQRYVLANRLPGYTIFRDRHRLCVAAVWFVTGVISSLPLIYSLSIYVHNKSLSHCVLDTHTMRFLFDTLSLFVPAVFLILAAFINSKANQHLQKRRGRRPLSRESNSNSRDGMAPIMVAGDFDSYTVAIAGEVTMGVMAAATLNSSMTSIETTLALIAVAYITALWTLAIYGLRTYGTWAGNNFSIPLASTHLLHFCSSFTRASVFLMVDQLARPYMQERGILDDTQRSSAYSTEQYQSPIWTWTQNYTSTSDVKGRSSEDSQARSDSQVKPSTHIPYTHSPRHSARSHKQNDMAAFWSNKPHEMMTSSEMINFVTDSKAVRSRLPLCDEPHPADLAQDRDIHVNDDVFAKNYKKKTGKSRRIKKKKKEHNFSSREAFDSHESGYVDKEAEPYFLLSSPTKRKGRQLSKGNLVWINRLSESETEGVAIYDRFLFEKNSIRQKNLPLGFSISDRAGDMKLDEKRGSNGDSGQFVIRTSNTESCTGATVKQRRQITKYNEDQSETSPSPGRSKINSNFGMNPSLAMGNEKRNSHQEGKLPVYHRKKSFPTTPNKN